MKKYGRAFNHLEDLIFFYGSDGVKEVIQHINEISNDPSLVRMKWDGGLQVYWGREYANGPLIMTGHNGWSRGAKCTTPADLYEFIVNQSGKDRDNVSESRKQFATKFGSLFPVLDAITPKDFTGFVYADALYLNRPPLCDDEYNFIPNNTHYYVHKDSKMGNRISKSNIMLAGHAFFDAFGLTDEAQTPLHNFDIFNNTDEVIVVNPYYSNLSPFTGLNQVEILHIDELTEGIDEFLRPIDGVSAFKDYIYRYNNYLMKTQHLCSFPNWINNNNISHQQQLKIMTRIYNETIGYNNLLALIDYVRSFKNAIIFKLDLHATEHDIKAHNPEGWVRYADETKKFGHIKLVPRHKWTP